MRILNLAYDDYANFMWDNCLALRAAGVDCNAYKIKPHAWYAEQALIANREFMASEVKKYDVIQFFHTFPMLFRYLIPFLRGRKVIAWHTGTPYRRNPQIMNAIFNDHVSFCFTDQCEFMSLGAKKIRYSATAIDERLIPAFRKKPSWNFDIAHYPSNPAVKGTADIIRMMEKIKRMQARRKFRFQYSANKVENKHQLRRIGQCDIYIELFKNYLEGKPYGCYGVTAFEAAAMGKVIVTQNIFPNVYRKEYKTELPFIICNSENDFIERVNHLINLGPADLISLQNKTSEWLKKYHSHYATGLRLRKIIERGG